MSSRGGVVCDRCAVASTALARATGLLGRRSLEPGDGLLLTPAASVHTAFMRFPIDVVFLDRQLRVLDVVARVRPWRLLARRRARAVLELAAGDCTRRGIRPGERLTLSAGPRG